MPKISTIRDQVYEILKERICTGEYEGGRWLQEVSLAEELNVSRSPVRDALHQLAKVGLVEEIPNRGVYVREFTEKDIEELFAARIMFEEYAIRLIAEEPSGDIRRALEAFRANFCKYAGEKNLAEYAKIDTIFHRSLIEMTGNLLLLHFYDQVKDQYARFRRTALETEGRFEESLQEHTGIIDAILKGEVAEAVAVNRQHLLNTRNHVKAD